MFSLGTSIKVLYESLSDPVCPRLIQEYFSTISCGCEIIVRVPFVWMSPRVKRKRILGRNLIISLRNQLQCKYKKSEIAILIRQPLARILERRYT